MAYSQPIMFQSQGDMRESIETRAMDLGLDTINVIEHMDQLNSAVGILLNKNSKYSYVCYGFLNDFDIVHEWTMNDLAE